MSDSDNKTLDRPWANAALRAKVLAFLETDKEGQNESDAKDKPDLVSIVHDHSARKRGAAVQMTGAKGVILGELLKSSHVLAMNGSGGGSLSLPEAMVQLLESMSICHDALAEMSTLFLVLAASEEGAVAGSVSDEEVRLVEQILDHMSLDVPDENFEEIKSSFVGGVALGVLSGMQGGENGHDDNGTEEDAE